VPNAVAGREGAFSVAVVAPGSGGGIGRTLALDGLDVRARVLIDSLAFDLWPTDDMRALLAIPDVERTPGLLRDCVAGTLDFGMRRGPLTDDDLREYQRPFADEDGNLVGSIVVIEPSDPSATHTEPSATVRPVGASATGNVRSRALLSGSMCETVLSRKSATQTPSGPVASARGPLPTGIL